MHRFPHRPEARGRDTFRSRAALAGALLLPVLGAVGCSDTPEIHPALRGTGASEPAVPCDESQPLGGAICASREMEDVIEETSSRPPWEKFTDKLDRALSFDPTILVGLGILAVGIWIVLSANGRVLALAEGRSATGPAAGLRTVAVGKKLLVGAWFIVAGAVVTAAAIGHPGAIFLTVVAAALVGWGLVRRGGTLTAAGKGFEAIERHYQSAVAAAQAAADTEAARAAAADPDAALGLNLAPEPPRRVTVPEPAMTIAEAAVIHRTGGVGIVAGSATAALLDGRGRPGPAVKFWHAACEAAKAGSTDEQGNFIPAASVDRVVPLDGGDALLVVIPANAGVGDVQLRGVTGPLLRVAGIRSAGSWEWDGSAFSIRLSNNAAPATPAAPPSAPKSTPTDDDWV